MTRRLPSLFVLSLAVLSGCGLVGSGPVVVSGTVTMDGEPLAEGVVDFLSTESDAPVTAEVKEGVYQAEIPPGRRRVEIRSPEVVGRKPVYDGQNDGPMQDVVVERVAAEFNTNSTITIDVGTGPATHDFAVESADRR